MVSLCDEREAVGWRGVGKIGQVGYHNLMEAEERNGSTQRQEQ